MKSKTKPSSVVLDTNALVLFFSQKNRRQAKQVKQLLESTTPIIIPDVVLPELEYILRHKYHQDRRAVKRVLQFIIDQPNILLSLPANTAIDLFHTSKLDLSDCLIASHARETKSYLASFDKQLLKASLLKSFFDN